MGQPQKDKDGMIDDVRKDWDESMGWSRHIIAAVFACILSVALHVTVVYSLSGVGFSIYAPVQPESEDWVGGPLKILEVTPREIERSVLSNTGKDGNFIAKSTVPADIPDLQMDESVVEPPPIEEKSLASVMDSIAGPAAMPERNVWTPRQDILVIEKKMVANDDVAVMPRKYIPKLERVADAPDIVDYVDRSSAGLVVAGGASTDGVMGDKPGVSAITTKARGGHGNRELIALSDVGPAKENGLFGEKLSEITDVRPLDRYLAVDVTVYSSLRDFRYGYFKIEVHRAGSEVLPVLPKDIVLVQDSSASITDQRLYFCKKGLIDCLDRIGAGDRFNVVGFSDKTSLCFPDWVSNGSDKIDKAKVFINNMKSEGDTDIFNSVKELLAMKRDPSRPVVVMLVTDGRANTGVTRSSNIIGEFSKLNDGAVSVFTMGTITTANNYLLDLLGYCNKGASYSVAGGRWGISESMQEMFTEISRPVMSGIKFRFAAGSKVEVFPLLASNLYLDRPLVLYGRYPRGEDRTVFQAVGDAGSTRCDMLFDISLKKNVKEGTKYLRQEWAKHKIYHLIGEYARNPDMNTLRDIKTTAGIYDVEIPYEGKF